MFPFPIIAPARNRPLTTTFVGIATNTANTATYTYASTNIGDGDYLVVGAAALSGVPDSTASLKVDGVDMSYLAFAGGSVVFGIMPHPKTGTASIVHSLNSASNRSRIAVWTINGDLNSFTPVVETVDNSTPLSADVALAEGSALYAVGISTNTTTHSFTGATTDSSASIESLNAFNFGHYDAASDEPSHTVSIGANSFMEVIVWR